MLYFVVSNVFFHSSFREVSDIYIVTDSSIVSLYFDEEQVDIPVYPGSMEVEMLQIQPTTLEDIPMINNPDGTTKNVPGMYYKNWFGNLFYVQTVYVLELNDYYRLDVNDSGQVVQRMIKKDQSDLPEGLYDFFEKAVWNNGRGFYLNH